eukprot:1194263-Prorocentrum_minimum.AAC.4
MPPPYTPLAPDPGIYAPSLHAIGPPHGRLDSRAHARAAQPLLPSRPCAANTSIMDEARPASPPLSPSTRPAFAQEAIEAKKGFARSGLRFQSRESRWRSTFPREQTSERIGE